MDIDLTGFSPVQQQALCDLLILSEYADGHLPTVDEAHLQPVLATLGGAEASVRLREFDASVARMRPAAQSVWKARSQAVALAGAFTHRPQQKRVYEAVQAVMNADPHVSTWECTLLSELRMKFRL
jgi:hypothetical protein